MLKPYHGYLSSKDTKQFLTIPPEFTFPGTGTEFLLCKKGDRLIVELIRPGSLLALLTTLEDIAEPFPCVDEGLFITPR